MLEWFDFYGIAIYFSVNHDTKYRSRLGTILTILNILLILVILPIEFFTRADIKHSWNVEAWEFNITHNPTMFQTRTVSNDSGSLQDVNELLKKGDAFASYIQLAPNYYSHFNQTHYENSLDLLYNLTSFKVQNLYRNKSNGLMTDASSTTVHSFANRRKRSNSYEDWQINFEGIDLTSNKNDDATESTTKIDFQIDSEMYNKMLYNDYCLTHLSCRGRVLTEAQLTNYLVREEWHNMTLAEKLERVKSNSTGYYTFIVDFYQNTTRNLQITQFMSQQKRLLDADIQLALNNLTIRPVIHHFSSYV